jgi:hypothetical protein
MIMSDYDDSELILDILETGSNVAQLLDSSIRSCLLAFEPPVVLCNKASMT